MDIKDKYKEWCKLTKRGGSVLVGGSINEFFEWLDSENYLLIERMNFNSEPYVNEFDLRHEIIEFMDYANSVELSNNHAMQEIKLMFNNSICNRKLYSNKKGYAIKEILHFYDGNNCFWCDKELQLLKVLTGDEYKDHDNISTIDHILPLKQGGFDNYSNMVLSCKKCNEKKRNYFWTKRFIANETIRPT